MDKLVEQDDRVSADIRALREAAEPPAPLTPGELRAIMVSLMLAMFLAALDQTIVATALPTME